MLYTKTIWRNFNAIFEYESSASSDVHVTASLCGYSTVGKVWTLFVYVNDGNGASAMRCIVKFYFLAFIEWT